MLGMAKARNPSPKGRALHSSAASNLKSGTKRPPQYWNSGENKRSLLDSIGKKLQGPTEEGLAVFYKLRKSDFHEAGASTLLFRHKSSVLAILRDVFPDHQWRPWLFDRSPRHSWNDLADGLFQGDAESHAIVLEYIEYLKKKYKVTTDADWAHVASHLNSAKELYRLAHFGSLAHLLRAVYPSKDWSNLPSQLNEPLESAASTAPQSFWNYPKNRREYLNGVVGKGGKEEDLYTMSLSTLLRTKGRGLTQIYGGSQSLAIIVEFPEVAWRPWAFEKSPRRWWSELAQTYTQSNGHDIVALTTVKGYLEEASAAVGVLGPAQWSPETIRSFENDQPTGRLRRLDSLESLLFRVYPGYKGWKLTFPEGGLVVKKSIGKYSATPLPRNYFDKKEHRRSYLEFLRRELGGDYQSLYNVSFQQAYHSGGTALLKKYNGSIAMAIMSELATEFDWKGWKFTETPAAWWTALAVRFQQDDKKTIDTMREFLDDKSKSLGVDRVEDWTQAASNQLVVQTLAPLRHFGPLSYILSKVYPHISWNIKGEEPKSAEMHRIYTPKPVEFWYNTENRWAYYEKLKDSLKLVKMADWYRIEQIDLTRNGGSLLVSLFDNSPMKMVSSDLVDHAWQRWKFSLAKASAWWTQVAYLFHVNDPVAETIVRGWLDGVAADAGINTLDGWQRQKKQIGSASTIQRLKALGHNWSSLLQEMYPEYAWQPLSFEAKQAKAHLSQKKMARRISRALKSNFVRVHQPS